MDNRAYHKTAILKTATEQITLVISQPDFSQISYIKFQIGNVKPALSNYAQFPEDSPILVNYRNRERRL